MPSKNTSLPAAFSRLHTTDGDTDRVMQDVYDKLAQVQSPIAQLTSQLSQLRAELSKRSVPPPVSAGASTSTPSGNPNAGSAPAALIEDTHANRLANYPATSYAVATAFFETDRGLLYTVNVVSGVNTWVYSLGTGQGLHSARWSDLGTSDARAEYIETDRQYRLRWSGTAWIYLSGVSYGLHSTRWTDLAAGDAGAWFVETDRNNGLHYWDGTEWVLAEVLGYGTHASRWADLGTYDAGALYIETDTGYQTFRWDGTTWVLVGIASAATVEQVLVNAAQFDKTTNTTPAAVTGLSASVVAGNTYRFEADVMCLLNLTGGAAIGINGSCSVSSVSYHVEGFDDSSGTLVRSNRSSTLGGYTGVTGYTLVFVRITGTAVVTGDGSLAVYFAEQVASGTSSVLAGSSFMVTPT